MNFDGNYIYPTLSGTMTQLKAEGYTEDFNLGFDCVHCRGENLKISPDEFQVDKFFRFEGESNPDDSSILYAISSEKHGVKGVLVNGYGIYSDALTDEMIAKLKSRH